MIGSLDPYENAFRRVFGKEYFSHFCYDKNDIKIGYIFNGKVDFIRSRDEFLLLLYKFGKNVRIESSVDIIDSCCRVNFEFIKRKVGRGVIQISLPFSYLEFDKDEDFFPITDGKYVVRFLDKIVVSNVFFNREVGEDGLLRLFDKVERTSESQYRIDVQNNIYYEMKLSYF